jgi:hypothetical protein
MLKAKRLAIHDTHLTPWLEANISSRWVIPTLAGLTGTQWRS